MSQKSFLPHAVATQAAQCRLRVSSTSASAAGMISCTGQVARGVVADAKNGFP